MGKKSRRSWPSVRSVGVATLLVVCLSMTTPAMGLTPKSPEVVRAVERGIAFLNSDKAEESRIGGIALRGLTLLKDGADQSNPKVAQAAARIHAMISKAGDPSKLRIDSTYSVGIAIMFLVELDPVANRPQIDFMLAHSKFIQKPHGGWGYPHLEAGDTSMTQYGVLGCWKATQAGIPLPPGVATNMTSWLLRTQGPDGSFGYQGVLGNPGLVPQKDVGNTMVAAGLGSLYVCGDIGGINKRIKRENDKDGLPSAMKRVGVDPILARNTSAINVNMGQYKAALARGNGWMERNYLTDPGRTANGYPCYYLYALERYQSFRELAEGRTAVGSRWYDDGARYLIGKQAEDGSWSSLCGNVCGTAFATLFLMRSSRKAIEKARDFGAGTLIGGRGLPKDSRIVKIRQGQVVATPKLEAIEKLLSATEDTDDADFGEMTALPPEDARVLVSKHAAKLKELSGDTSADARFAAVKLLGQTSDLEHVPTLIYALSDPTPEIVLEARNGLRRISRRFAGFGLPDKFTPADVEAAVRRWKKWYLAIRPDANFEN